MNKICILPLLIQNLDFQNETRHEIQDETVGNTIILFKLEVTRYI